MLTCALFFSTLRHFGQNCRCSGGINGMGRQITLFLAFWHPLCSVERKIGYFGATLSFLCDFTLKNKAFCNLMRQPWLNGL